VREEWGSEQAQESRGKREEEERREKGKEGGQFNAN
jgi:hypothetical protein